MSEQPDREDEQRIELKEVIGNAGTWTVVSTDNGNTSEDER